MTEKDGFSVVAATSTTVRFSTPGSNASCWALLKRWISSRNRTVSVPYMFFSRVACSITVRTSLTPALMADSSTNLRPLPATRCAMVVFPVPGGPHRMADTGPTPPPATPSTRRRSGEPGRSASP